MSGGNDETRQHRPERRALDAKVLDRDGTQANGHRSGVFDGGDHPREVGDLERERGCVHRANERHRVSHVGEQKRKVDDQRARENRSAQRDEHREPRIRFVRLRVSERQANRIDGQRE